MSAITIRPKTHYVGDGVMQIDFIPVTLDDMAHAVYSLSLDVEELSLAMGQTTEVLSNFARLLKPHKSIIRKRKRREQWRKRR